MPLRELEHLFQHSSVRKYTKGQILLYPGDHLNHVFFMRRGYLKLYSNNDQGDERILMIFPTNTAFPIVPNLLATERYVLQYFYQAMTDIEIYQLTREEFGQILEHNDYASQMVLEYVTQLAGELVRRLGIIENKDATNKIASVMSYLTKVCAKEVSPDKFLVNFKITHQDIASLAGLARETTSLQVKQLETNKVIEQKKGGRLVINAALLPQ